MAEWWSSTEKTAESFAPFSKKDAASLKRWVEEFRPIAEAIVTPEARSPPLEPERRREALERFLHRLNDEEADFI